MKREDEFDCVEMKTAIQAQLREEVERLGEEEAHRLQWERALASPPIRAFLDRLAEQGGSKAA